jgi:2-desacetyl-2-hydroxyethyl bacteriochlorophyllide A dehydrogenase
VDFEEAAMAEPAACCLHGIDNVGIEQGDTVCVIGGGAIGQIMAQLARISGASKVVVSEPVRARRNLALSLGADAAIDPTKGDIKAQLKEAVGKDYANVIIECVGKPIAVSQAVYAAGRGSRVLLFSLPYPTDTYELPLNDVFRKELHITGSFVNPDTQYRAARLISTKRLNLKPLVTHRYPVEKLEEAIKMQMGNESVKVMIIPE